MSQARRFLPPSFSTAGQRSMQTRAVQPASAAAVVAPPGSGNVAGGGNPLLWPSEIPTDGGARSDPIQPLSLQDQLEQAVGGSLFEGGANELADELRVIGALRRPEDVPGILARVQAYDDPKIRAGFATRLLLQMGKLPPENERQKMGRSDYLHCGLPSTVHGLFTHQSPYDFTPAQKLKLAVLAMSQLRDVPPDLTTTWDDGQTTVRVQAAVLEVVRWAVADVIAQDDLEATGPRVVSEQQEVRKQFDEARTEFEEAAEQFDRPSEQFEQARAKFTTTMHHLLLDITRPTTDEERAQRPGLHGLPEVLPDLLRGLTDVDGLTDDDRARLAFTVGTRLNNFQTRPVQLGANLPATDLHREILETLAFAINIEM